MRFNRKFFKEAFKAGYKKALTEAKSKFTEHDKEQIFDALVEWTVVEFGFYYIGTRIKDDELANTPFRVKDHSLPLDMMDRMIKNIKDISKSTGEKITLPLVKQMVEVLFDDIATKTAKYIRIATDEWSVATLKKLCYSLKDEAIKEVTSILQ